MAYSMNQKCIRHLKDGEYPWKEHSHICPKCKVKSFLYSLFILEIKKISGCLKFCQKQRKNPTC